jgi:orotate phosphoribosyltransferase
VSKFSSTHNYCYSQNPDRLLEWAEENAKKLFDKMKELKFAFAPIFCYRGSSGISHATALSMSYMKFNKPFYMAYVRKENEHSHGSTIERSFWTDSDKFILVFVDDLVSSGETKRITLQTIVDFFEKQRNSMWGVSFRWNRKDCFSVLNDGVEKTTFKSAGVKIAPVRRLINMDR